MPGSIDVQLPPPPGLSATLSPAPGPGGESPASSPSADDDLRRQLRLSVETIARHEKAIEALQTALSARPAPGLTSPAPPSEAWYERLRIRGYLQIRYNQIPSAASNENLINEQGDKSIGGTGGLFIRRGRIILLGDLHDRVSIYIQPDFASSIGEQLHISIMRDYYADIFLDRKKEFRLRIGQSKVPFGFENLQSSQNRIPFDRSDSLNSAVLNERDLAAFFYWAPAPIRSRFRQLVDSGLKGSGDYGVVGFGVFNGQTANRLEINKFPHVVARLTWPFAIGRQFLELGGGGYYGQYTVKLEPAKDGTKFTTTSPDNTLADARGHVSAVLYPKPLGFIFEYNVGVGPALGVDEPTVVDARLLYGGYLQVMAKLDRLLGTVALLPYVRGTLYSGGKKFFVNAPHYEVREIEFGAEWQIVSALELVIGYLIADRTSDKYPYQPESGHVVRLQAQLNY